MLKSVFAVVSLNLLACNAFRFQKISFLPSTHSRSPFHAPSLMATLSDDVMEKYLDEMIYSGDIEGYIRRHVKDLISEDFKEYIEDILPDVEDEDEKEAIQEALALISKRLQATDGISNSGIVFERRLDKILFAPPQARREYIQENLEDMSPGFIEYIQKELKETSDNDSKVVLASILQMIGSLKDADFLGANIKVLTEADTADAYQKAITLGANQEGADGAASVVNPVMNVNEQILAGLMFSTNDVLEDVLNNLHVINDDFVKYLTAKVDSVTDMEERLGLSSLLQVITTVLERVREAETSGDDMVRDEELSIDQIRTRMQEVQMGQEIKNSGEGAGVAKKKEFVVQTDAKATFQLILAKFEECYNSGMNVTEAVVANYNLCDYKFMEMLKSEADACFAEGAGIEGQGYLDILAAINKEMANQVGIAQTKLARILNKKIPAAMESEVVAMVKKGEMDEALVLLIEANAQQATKAGATAAADVLGNLVKRARVEMERLLPEEQKLLRALLRITLPEERKGLLYEAFRPTKSMNVDGEVTQGAPLIAPPAFITIVKQFIMNFGNVEGFNIMGRAQDIITEAETVATELFGESMTPRMQQEMMLKKNTMSVWDLGNYEDLALLSGEEIPWENNSIEGKNPEDVLVEKTRKQIGGIDSDV